MNKKGVSLTFNTIVIAAIALIVLIVLWIIFAQGIGRGSAGIEDVGEEATGQVSQVTWCMPTTIQGKGCEEKAEHGCVDAELLSVIKEGKEDPNETKYTCRNKEGQKVQRWSADNKPRCCKS